MSSLPSLVYLILAAAAFALAVGGFVWLVAYISRGMKEKEPPQGEKPESPGAETHSPPDEIDLLRVSRGADGKLTIFVQGKPHRHLREITESQVGRETVEAIKAVLTFAEGWLPSIHQPPPPPPPESNIPPESFLRQLRYAPPPPSTKPPGLLAPLQSRIPSNMLDPLPLVDEIDEIVQRRLQEHPELEKRHVRLTTNPSGGLRIYVGQQAFDAVSDITDPQIKALIQDAIHEWEGD